MPSILSCRFLLLLTMVHFVAVNAAGRHIPAAPLIASLTPTPQVEVEVNSAAPESLGFSGVTWKRDSHIYQDASKPAAAHRKVLIRGNVKGRSRVDVDSIYGHRLLVGSAPPSCAGKCGACVPCSPIHVSVSSPHAGSLTQQEYYPEVWRCKCGNKLFMP